MKTPLLSRTSWGLASSAVLLLTACDAPTPPALDQTALAASARAAQATVAAENAEGSSFFRVYNRNVYLGGDTGPLFTLDFSQLPANIGEVVAAVSTFWDEVQASQVAQRAAAVADEIETLEPHVVGLQEVAAFAVVDVTTSPPSIVDGRDYLATLLGELAARGLDYLLVTNQVNVNSQLPMAVGPAGINRVLAFTLGEAVLVRGDVAVEDSESGMYQAVLDLGPVQIGRGYSRVETVFEGVPHHVVVTHLEVQGIRPIHDAQAQELYARFGNLEGVTLVMGDLNSDAEGVEGDPSWTPTYGFLTGQGFVDAWTERTGREEIGYTCCWDPDLMGGMLDERIDFVLVKPPAGGRASGNGGLPGAIHMTILGDEPGEGTTASGLRAGDHAALYAALNLPAGKVRTAFRK